MELEKPKKTKKRSREKNIKWWNLKNEEFEFKFITQVGETIENNCDRSTYEVVERDIVEIARRELGESGGGKYVEKETWWWDQQVQEAVKAKKEALNNWRTTGNEVKWVKKYIRSTGKQQRFMLLKLKIWHMKILTEDVDIRNRWSGYYTGLLNENNRKEQFQNVPETAG